MSQVLVEDDPIVVDLRLYGEDLTGLALIKRIRSRAPYAANSLRSQVQRNG